MGYFPHILRLMEELLSEIAAFCASNQMSERDFGLQALNDHKFVPQLRGELLAPDRKSDDPRSPSLKTVDRVRAFMRDYQPDAEARAA